jgi:hypothetical protein
MEPAIPDYIHLLHASGIGHGDTVQAPPAEDADMPMKGNDGRTAVKAFAKK